ncbi:MAG: 50S ribosomal protein L10 [Thermodesulfobacteriota bacterium]
MNRSEKENVVADLKDTIGRSNATFVADYRGLTVKDMVGLRKSLREASSEFKVVKNTLARLAFKGTEVEPLSDSFEGPTAIAFSCADPVATAKVLTGFAEKRPNLEIKCGALGSRIIDLGEVKALAKLPGLETLRGRIIGLLQAPGTQLVRLLNTPGTQVARVLHAYSDKGEG